MAEIIKKPFGTTPDGKAVDLYRLTDKNGFSVELITYGGAVRSIAVPVSGGSVDVALGTDDIEGYIKQDKYYGAILGRYANRIGGGKFCLNGREYSLFVNNGPNHLHGGKEGFDKKVWEAEREDNAVTLRYFSPDGEEGYPGNLNVSVKYSVSNGSLIIETEAVCDSDTVVNISNHPYFNLNGHGDGDISGHIMKIYAESFTEIDGNTLATGRILPVKGTPMDFLEAWEIGEGIDDGYVQIKYGSGYDHNWALKKSEKGGFEKAAEVYSPKTRIKMEVITTQPGIQFYSGNFLDGNVLGKNGAVYSRRSGFALETQGFPNAVNCPNFPSPALKKGDIYRQKTVYKFTEE